MGVRVKTIGSVGCCDYDQVAILTSKFDFVSLRTTMPARKSQKHGENDKKMEKVLEGLARGQFESGLKAARVKDVAHSTLLLIKGRKSMTKFY